jgi:hypothetical protein
MKSILHPYELRTIKWSSALSWCGWLASSFDQCLHERTICENTTWIVITSSLLGVACFSCSILLIASTKHLKCSSDHHFHEAFQVPHLVYPHIGRQAPTLERSDISPKNHSWPSLKMNLLIDPSNGLNLMSNLESFIKFFSFYLFKSFSFYQIISNSH